MRGESRGTAGVGRLCAAAFVLATAMGPSGADVQAQPHAYGGEAVQFAAGGKVLAGTLFLPDAARPAPAVVVVNGSGGASYQTDFWRGGHFWTGITRHLLDMGVAVLHYDKPGVGDSTGDWRRESIEDRAANAMAAVHLLHSRDEIDPERIGLLGYSQGGYAAYLAGARHPDRVAFLVTLAAPSVSVRRQIADDRSYHWTCDAAPAANVRMAGLSIFLGLHTLLSYVAPVNYLARIVRFDPRSVVGDIEIPTLAIFAEHDPFVPVRPNADELLRHFPNPALLSMHVVEAADHQFRTSAACPRGSGLSRFAEGFSAALQDPFFWLKALP